MTQWLIRTFVRDRANTHDPAVRMRYGQLAGTVYAALGLGVLNKFLEGWMGAVLAKIAVLVLIIVFIQKRPQGIFAMKGRSADVIASSTRLAQRPWAFLGLRLTQS